MAPEQHNVVTAAAALAPRIRAARDEMETERRLPASLVRALSEAGLFQLYLPRTMGGRETDPLTCFRAIEELSMIDGSVGWCALTSSSGSSWGGWLQADVGRALFGGPQDLRIAGSNRPEGDAHIVDDGYIVRGRWAFASGIGHANWFASTCAVVGDNGPRLTSDGIPEIRALLVPVDAGTIHDTWSVMGMCGTGNHDFAVDDVFVPAERTFSVLDPPQESGPLYHPRMKMVVNRIPFAGNSLGMARGAMDAFVELAASTSSSMTAAPLRERPLVQTTVAQAEIIISAARAHVLDAVGTAWEAVCHGVPDPSLEIARGRMAVTHAVQESVRAVDLLFHAAGTNAIYRKHPLERFFWDIHVAVQHGSGLTSELRIRRAGVDGAPPKRLRLVAVEGLVVGSASRFGPPLPSRTSTPGWTRFRPYRDSSRQPLLP